MEVIDLTHTIHDDLQIFPGDPAVPSIRRGLIHEKDYCHVDVVRMGTHTGTHIDAPFHFLNDGKKIDEIPVDRFVGNGVLVDVSEKSDRGLIEVEDVRAYSSEINNGDFVIFYTGRDKFFGTERYYLHPYLNVECARFLLNLGVSLVGVDALNVDPTYWEINGLEFPAADLPDEREYGYPVHNIFLGNDILIVENLCNLDKIHPARGVYSFLPLKLLASDGSPIRAVFLGI
jgi:kynurenine formamidase